MRQVVDVLMTAIPMIFCVELVTVGPLAGGLPAADALRVSAVLP